MTVMTRKYGWRPDLPDHRDRIFQASAAPSALPSSIDLRALCPPVYDQGQIGSCTANAIAAAIQFDQSKQNLPSFAPSRLFLYYNERALEGTTASDSGATLRDGMRTVNKVGVCPETLWPYSMANVLTRPPEVCFQASRAHRSLFYAHIPQTLSYMKMCLATGFPFVFGISVYESFESNSVTRTGVVPLPDKNESFLGGHAMLAAGYDDATARFLVRNSWGSDWGWPDTAPYSTPISKTKD